MREEVAERDPFAGESGRGSHWSLRASAAPPSELTNEQVAALGRLRHDPMSGSSVWPAPGVTGSGKTEVYLRLRSTWCTGAAACSCWCPRLR